MNQEIFSTLNELASRGTSFAIATVIETEGSSSAQTGSKALIDSKAKVILGWVGGGCVENVVRQEAMGSITDGKTRIVTVDLTDEILGVGMPCGGKMRVFIEPVLPPPRLVIAGRGRIAETVAQFAHTAGFSVTVADPGATLEDFPTADQLAKVGFSSLEIDIGPETYVVVATQHKGDHLSLKKAIECGAVYIGLVASKTRAQLVFDYLAEIGISRNRVDQAKVRAPAGIDIGAKTPEEVALSIVSEMVQVRRGGSGRSMQDAKGIRLNNETGSDRQTGRGPDASTSANGSKDSSAWHPSFP